MWSLFLPEWNWRSFFLDTTVTPSKENLPTPLRWALGITLKGNGYWEGGRPTCFSTANGVLALNGKNYFHCDGPHNLAFSFRG